MVPAFVAVGHVVEHRQQQDVFGDAGQAVAVAGVEGEFRVERDLGGDHAALLPAERLAHVAAGRDEARFPGVGRAGDGAAVFDGPQARDREQVFVTGRVAPPAVVRNDGHELRAAAHESAVEVAVKPFVADRRSGFDAVVLESRAVQALAYLSDRAAQVDDQEFHRVEDPRRGVFDADHQPAFVVQLHAARGVQPHGRVEAVVIAVAETFRAGRLGLRPGRVAANGAGSGDEQEGIPYKYKTKDHLSQTMYPAEGTLRSRTGSFGNKPDQMIEYEILVHKKDYEKVRGKF